VIVSQKGWLRSRQGHGHDIAQFNFKAGDGPYGVFECRSTDALIAFGDNGRVYSVAVSGLPSARGDGAPVTSMIDLEPGSHIEHMIAAAADSKWLLSTSQGFGFSTKLSDMTSRQRAGKQFVTLEEKDRLLRPVPLFELATHVAFLTSRGKLLVIALDEVKSLASGGRGTILMGIDAPDVLTQTVPVSKAGLRVTGTYRTKQVQDILSGALLDIYVSKRARKGRLLDIRSKEPILSPVL
jgi:topoisomerase-4 subunit A